MCIRDSNYGARNKKRLLSALKQGCVIALILMTLGLLVFLLFPAQLLGIFNEMCIRDRPLSPERTHSPFRMSFFLCWPDWESRF